MSKVVIYGTTLCTKCKQLNKICETKNYAVTYKNVDPSDDNFKMLLANSVKSFPALEIEGKFIFSKSLEEFEQLIANCQ